MTTLEQTPISILRRKQVEARTGLSRSTIYDKLNPNSPRYDSNFPRSIKLGVGAVGWLSSEIEGWLQSRIAESRR
ncbi:helix-turn-helix transcriptional regulator [Alkalimarinus sediminis]|uniref:AlpA family transcriptional regulator n=1 Tax=Alkalimarinus sediminis TaxID=1632866 RepID=A0A9E8KQ44_9ALTE|nr:AlpA family transcriptional regulator [Alkalimarinus sediminis]UZW74242.1 AlpA family transcriptional regulator [Alkalimarinus sediminis]